MKSLILFITLLASSSIALALDGKIYTAASCTQSTSGNSVHPQNFSYDNNVRYSAWGWAYNASADTDITVICPIVREHHASRIYSARLTVVNTTDHGIRCTIIALSEEGFQVNESDTFYFPPTLDIDPIVETLDVKQLMNHPQPYAAYLLKCGLPHIQSNSKGGGMGIAGIVGYMIEEDN